jgi:hypothetical protein
MWWVSGVLGHVADILKPGEIFIGTSGKRSHELCCTLAYTLDWLMFLR